MNQTKTPSGNEENLEGKGNYWVKETGLSERMGTFCEICVVVVGIVHLFIEL